MSLDKELTELLDLAPWADIEEYIQQRKQRDAATLAKEGEKLRKEAEALILEKFGFKLSQIFTATDKEPKPVEKYNKPGGGIYVYKGKGQMPKWFKTEVDEVAAGKVKNEGLGIDAARIAARQAVRDKYLAH